MILLLLPLSAFASPDERWLSTDRVAIGIAEDGSLGNSEAGLGVMFDPDGPKGPMPVGGDVLYVGRVFDVWSLSATVDGQPWTRVQGASDGNSDLVFEPTSGMEHYGYLSWQGESSDSDVSVAIWHALPWGQPLVWTKLTIKPRVALVDLRVTRVFDPDLDYWATGSTSTINLVGEGVVVASGVTDGRSWALAGRLAYDPAGAGGICTWCTTADEILGGSSTSTGDDQLGWTVTVGDLSRNQEVDVIFVYGFGADVDGATNAVEDGLEVDLYDFKSLEDGGYNDTGLGDAPDPDEIFGEDEAIPTEPTRISTGSRSCSTGVGGGLWLLLPLLLRRSRR